MTEDQEIVLYLGSLLDHYAECKLDGCSACSALLGIIGSIKQRLFCGPVYAKVMIATRRPNLNPGAPIQATSTKLRRFGKRHPIMPG